MVGLGSNFGWNTATGGTGNITFDANGSISSSGTGTANFAIPGANAISLNIDFLSLPSLGPTAYINFQDGYEAGSLDMVSTDSGGG